MTNAISYAAIRTRYYGPTDTKGSRIVAYRPGSTFCPAERITMPYNYAGSNTENHHAAAVLHLAKFNAAAKIRPEGLSWDRGLSRDMFWTWSCE